MFSGMVVVVGGIRCLKRIQMTDNAGPGKQNLKLFPIMAILTRNYDISYFRELRRKSFRRLFGMGNPSRNPENADVADGDIEVLKDVSLERQCVLVN